MLTILNDLHIGAVRTGGTTPRSAFALRDYLKDGFFKLVSNVETDLMILGDLFDTGAISLQDLLFTFNTLHNWLENNDEMTLYLVAGNHDLSRNSATLSSFQFLCKLLERDRVVSIFEPTMTPHGYVIPHLPNQDLFNSALESMPECDALFVHCNYENNFAVESDHSLNMSKEQAREVPCKVIVFGHEHNQRVALGGKVVIPGNQVASSVADCLQEEPKNYTILDQGRANLILVPDQPAYAEVDWRDTATQAKFVRVVGTATAEEAADAVGKVARLRQSSDAFVVTNAIDIKGDAINEEFAKSLENVKSFNVLEALKKLLSEDEIEIIESLK